MLNDLRYAIRMLLKSPGFTVVAVLTLVLGIGANTTIFSLINALLLRELPVREPHRLVALSTITPNGQPAGLSYLMFEEIRRGPNVFSSLFAWSGGTVHSLEANGVIWLSTVTFATGDYYRTLGVVPFMGRAVLPEDERPQSGSPNDIAVISYGCWQRRFGSDPAVIGKVVRVEGRPYTIVGVTPKSFLGLSVGASEDVTVPRTYHLSRPKTNSRCSGQASNRRPFLQIGISHSRKSSSPTVSEQFQRPREPNTTPTS